ncbi:hypothetical protein FJ960_13685 [Mesorhizobium sp. B2-3-11]|uniref:hypothetical protein n=1 Tax=Mesorhizobium sp. B2-3-11 TaxID=2589953 RepID=UPI00112A8E2D|nr:hypothetical protein [Mesorhizobium sp. B2-3-11]TPM05440.1 hypothetical protein FJ960_13685 [Mesorhizobium sp. B2-3-11]
MIVSLASLYDEILARYVKDLAEARAHALAWWSELVAREILAGRSKADAEHLCRMRWPMGAASHPRIIEVYRRYFLEVGEVNEEFLSHEIVDSGFNDPALWDIGPEDEDGVGDGNAVIQPAALLLEGLGRRDMELHNFMLHFIFLPIGMDSEGIIR